MSKLNAGEVEIVLNGEPRVLKPTLAAISTLSRIHGGLSGVRDLLVKQDLDCVCNVIRVGLGLKDHETKGLSRKVYDNGLGGELLVPLIKYVAILGNGGKPLDEDAGGEPGSGDDTTDGDQGND